MNAPVFSVDPDGAAVTGAGIDMPLGWVLGLHPLSDAEQRRKLAREAASSAAVILLHILFLAALVISLKPPTIRLGHPIETIIELRQQHREAAPFVRPVNPNAPAELAPEVKIAPITIMPPPAPEVPLTKEDILKGIGASLACGANSYETLSAAERAHCKRQPWMAKKNPNGNIVLAAPLKIAPPQVHITGAERNDRFRETADPCAGAKLAGAPCNHSVIFGDKLP